MIEGDRDTSMRVAAFEDVRRLTEIYNRLTVVALKLGFTLGGLRFEPHIARSISACLVSDKVGEPIIRGLGRALERIEIDVYHAKTAAIAFRPFESIKQGPNEITAQIYTGNNCTVCCSKVVAQIGDPIVIAHGAVRSTLIIVTSAVLSHIE